MSMFNKNGQANNYCTRPTCDQNFVWLTSCEYPTKSPTRLIRRQLLPVCFCAHTSLQELNYVKDEFSNKDFPLNPPPYNGIVMYSRKELTGCLHQHGIGNQTLTNQKLIDF